MALNFLMDLIQRNKTAVIFVDSLSVLKALENFNLKTRPDLVNEIYQLLYQLFKKGSDITFCWIPSHCNIIGNEQADKAAKQGAQQKKDFTKLQIPTSIEEYNNILEKSITSNFFNNPNLDNFSTKFIKFCRNQLKYKTVNYYRKIASLSIKLKLNSLKTKYCKLIKCKCGHQLSIEHLIKFCPLTTQFFTQDLRKKILNTEDITSLFEDHQFLLQCAENLCTSPLEGLL